MATNDFQPFAYGGAANVVSQSAYIALTSILQNGFSSGVAQSAQLNKVWRQSSIMAAVLAQFSSDYSGQNSTDDGTTATLETNLIAAIRSVTKTGVLLTDTGAANAYTASNVPALTSGQLVNGLVQQIVIAHANTGASTYAPDGLTASPIYGLGLQALQGGELPVGSTAVLMRATIAGVNGGSPIWVLMECAGGAQQIAPATQSQHAVQFGQVSGVVGSVRNAVMSVTAASASANWSADEVVLETALGGLRYCVGNASGTINLATTGAGGMDTGSAPVSGFVAIYGIYKPSTNTFNLLAKNATSAVQPNVYGGANMPAGYTASALVSVWPTNGSGQFIPGIQNDRKVTFNFVQVISTSTQTSVGTYTSFSAAGALPYNAKRCDGVIVITPSSTGYAAMGIAPASGANPIGIKQYYAYVVSGNICETPYSGLDIITAQTLAYTFSGVAGTFAPGVTAYEF